jgi:hypothetical protein
MSSLTLHEKYNIGTLSQFVRCKTGDVLYMLTHQSFYLVRNTLGYESSILKKISILFSRSLTNGMNKVTYIIHKEILLVLFRSCPLVLFALFLFKRKRASADLQDGRAQAEQL